MKLCKDCRHHERRLDSWCKHPSVGIDPVSGDLRKALCFLERGALSRTECGPDGALWEPVITPKPEGPKNTLEPSPEYTLFQKLKSFFK